MAQVTLADNLPPKLVTEVPAHKLGADQTPDAYGLDVLYDGTIANSGLTRYTAGASYIPPQVTIATVAYDWIYNRAWRHSGSNLIYGAPNYDDVYFPQGLGKVYFPEGDILDIAPLGTDSLCVLVAGGVVILQNCGDARNLIMRGKEIFEPLGTKNSSAILVYNSEAYIPATNGMFLVTDAGKTEELSADVRTTVVANAMFSTATMKANFDKGMIVAKNETLTEDWLYWVAKKGWYRYSATSAYPFLFTSRELRSPGGEAFSVERIEFHVQHPNTDAGTIEYQLNIEGQGWGDTQTVNVKWDDDGYTICRENLGDATACHRWQMRIVGLTGGKRIARIDLEADGYRLDDYTE